MIAHAYSFGTTLERPLCLQDYRQIPASAMTAPAADQGIGWLVRDRSIYHPDYFPVNEGW